MRQLLQQTPNGMNTADCGSVWMQSPVGIIHFWLDSSWFCLQTVEIVVRLNVKMVACFKILIQKLEW